MQFNNSEAMQRADSISPSCALDEIDLYPELCRFMDLSLKERIGQRDESNSKKQDLTESAKGESDLTPTDACHAELEVSTDQEKPPSESSADFVPAQAFHLDGLSPLEMLEPLSFNDQSAFLAADVGDGRLLSRDACLACGAESEAEDLFCVTCGAFLDEVASVPINPTCADCGQGKIADEIFCPWCGASLPAA